MYFLFFFGTAVNQLLHSIVLWVLTVTFCGYLVGRDNFLSVDVEYFIFFLAWVFYTFTFLINSIALKRKRLTHTFIFGLKFAAPTTISFSFLWIFFKSYLLFSTWQVQSIFCNFLVHFSSSTSNPFFFSFLGLHVL